MNKIVNTTHTRLWKVYKITFASDGYAYVGITNQPIPDRIDAHIRTPVNAELSTRLRKGLTYTYETLHEVTVEGADGDGIRRVYALEREEIYKLEKPINIHGISPEAQRNAKFWGHEQTDDNKARRTRKRTKRNVHPPRKGVYRCSICKKQKPHTKFHVSRDRFNGLNSRCKMCINFGRKKARREGKGRNMRASSAEMRAYIDEGHTIPESNRYTTLDEKEVIRLYESGLPCAVIAKQLGYSCPGVQYIINKAGIMRTRSEAQQLRRKQERENACD